MKFSHRVAGAREVISDPYRFRRMRGAMRKLRGMAPDGLPDDLLIEELRSAWGNRNWSADASYVREVLVRMRDCPGAVVECGSGLTTLAMGAYASSEKPVYALEHQAFFHRRIRRAVRRLDLDNCHPMLTPIRSYGEFDWYGVPDNLPPVGLVVCDGPPAATRGGRYGAMPCLSPVLMQGATIVLDDAEVERPALMAWRREFGIEFTVHETSRASLAVVSIP